VVPLKTGRVTGQSGGNRDRSVLDGAPLDVKRLSLKIRAAAKPISSASALSMFR
jgi:hypothetical protein